MKCSQSVAVRKVYGGLFSSNSLQTDIPSTEGTVLQTDVSRDVNPKIPEITEHKHWIGGQTEKDKDKHDYILHKERQKE